MHWIGKQKQESGKRKNNITVQVLHKALIVFPDSKGFIDEKLEQKCFKENISVEEVIYYSRKA